MDRTKTRTQIITASRLDVLGINFSVFLSRAGMDDIAISRMRTAVSNREIEAVGIYLESGGYKIAEVEYNIDWEKHEERCTASGTIFNLNEKGYVNGVCPEIRFTVDTLVDKAKKQMLPIKSWIRVTSQVRENPAKHKDVCDRLGFCYGKYAPGWNNGYNENTWNVMNLEETNVVLRQSK